MLVVTREEMESHLLPIILIQVFRNVLLDTLRSYQREKGRSQRAKHDTKLNALLLSQRVFCLESRV